jgi:oligopeptide/dipeptide ABC transporter ATP-binding protein
MQSLLEVKNLVKEFPVQKALVSFFPRRSEFVHAVSDVSFSIDRGETLGLVGESGCGKTTTGRCVLRLIQPTSGKVLFEGVDVCSLDKNELRNIRGKMQIIFQDPFSSLNPRRKVADIVGRAMELHGIASGQDVRRKVVQLLESVGLSEEHADLYPHQFSGGQRQRIAIARALAPKPSFIVADEPTSALDVSVQSQIINLLQDLRENYGFSCLFISHDLMVVEYVSDRVGVMYLGKIAELAPRNEIFDQPLHPYTRALLSSLPVPNPSLKRERTVLKGEVPNPINPPNGCRFHTRCPKAAAECAELEPKLRDVGNKHLVACHLFS